MNQCHVNEDLNGHGWGACQCFASQDLYEHFGISLSFNTELKHNVDGGYMSSEPTSKRTNTVQYSDFPYREVGVDDSQLENGKNSIKRSTGWNKKLL